MTSSWLMSAFARFAATPESMWLVLAAETTSAAQDPLARFVDVGLVGVFLVALIVGRWIILRREKDQSDAAWQKLLDAKQAELDHLREQFAASVVELKAAHQQEIQGRDAAIGRLEHRVESLQGQVDSRDTFIRDQLIENTDQLVSRHIDLIKTIQASILTRKDAGARET